MLFNGILKFNSTQVWHIDKYVCKALLYIIIIIIIIIRYILTWKLSVQKRRR